jgi:hypothetical protein
VTVLLQFCARMDASFMAYEGMSQARRKYFLNIELSISMKFRLQLLKAYRYLKDECRTENY